MPQLVLLCGLTASKAGKHPRLTVPATWGHHLLWAAIAAVNAAAAGNATAAVALPAATVVQFNRVKTTSR